MSEYATLGFAEVCKGDCYETAIRDDDFRESIKSRMSYPDKFPPKPKD